MGNKTALILTDLGLLSLSVACAGPATPIYGEVTPASFTPGSPIPPPSGEVILTVAGDISVTNVGDTLQLDMPTLESLGLVKYTVNDPYRLDEDGELEQVTYTGVLMSTLMEYLGVSEESDKFHIVALDDYRINLSFADVKRWPVLLATRANGKYMSVENSGSTRIIFPYGYFDIDSVRYNDLWIWNIKSMRVD